MSEHATIHATTVAIRGHGVLISGPSGSGKSDLALRLIDRGAMLVADDYTDVTHVDGRLIATVPPTIAGRIEVRGIGIVTLPHADAAPIALSVRLTDAVIRMPEASTHQVAGVDLPAVAIDPRPASAPILVEIALRELAP